MIQIAFLMAPLALLAACGQAPAESTQAQKVYTFNHGNGTWDPQTAPNAPTEPTDPSQQNPAVLTQTDPAVNPASTPTPSPTATSTSGESGGCTHIADCIPTNLLVAQLPIDQIIPHPLPDPSPVLGTRVVFASAVYEVTGYVHSQLGSARINVPLVTQVGTIVLR